MSLFRISLLQLYFLLEKTKVQSLKIALQLLGPEYPDSKIRSLAVDYLQANLTAELLHLYLLQLVQVQQNV